MSKARNETDTFGLDDDIGVKFLNDKPVFFHFFFSSTGGYNSVDSDRAVGVHFKHTVLDLVFFHKYKKL